LTRRAIRRDAGFSGGLISNTLSAPMTLIVISALIVIPAKAGMTAMRQPRRLTHQVEY
jgi:hypothetical protein